MKIIRKYTKAGEDVFASVDWTTRSSKISNLDGSVVFEMKDVQVPKSWSQLATDIMVSKYFRKAGVPQVDQDEQVVHGDNGEVATGPERSVRQVIHRLAGCWRDWGQRHGYFDTEEDGQAFYDELCYMLLRQMCAPNSPQWFNTGLNFAYGITGPAQGHWVVDPATGQMNLATDAYSHPQPHACFIQSADDDLVNPGGIMDLWVREARLFKYGSGTGTNFSMLRGEGESLSGGGKSSGLMSFLKIGDRAAGAIKSGGTTRRAAKMVCLDLDHPDIEQFVDWKVREEIKVAAMVEGMKRLDKEQKKAAEATGLKLDYDFNGESYMTVSGQNSNNSVRIPNAFFEALGDDEDWALNNRTDGQVQRHVSSRTLWDKIAYAAWRCADPGVQFDSTINQWHTCPNSGRINASNPCSEYMFLDNTACNLASLNLIKFYDNQTGEFDVESFEHGVELWTIVLEISVLMAAFPSEEIARRSYEFRTLGLGYANIGAMLLQAGIPYDSEKARTICGAITAILTGRSYATSAKMARELGPFPGYFKNRHDMLRVVSNHRRAAHGVARDAQVAGDHTLGAYEELDIAPVPIDPTPLLDEDDPLGGIANAQDLITHAQQAWDDALELGKKFGYRNAQATVIAPTGTIGLLMDCDTTGVEPDFALVKFKKLAGGGYFKIANQSLRPALVSLGYTPEQTQDIMRYVMGELTFEVPMPGDYDGAEETVAEFLRGKGMNDADIRNLTDLLPTVFEMPFAFAPWAMGDETLARIGIDESTLATVADGVAVLKRLGLDTNQIEQLAATICGTQTVEGAPHMKDEHLPVFDCANQCGPTGQRFIATEGHIRMMAAAQSFITGAISKTINLPNNASVDDIQSAYRLSWELGLKANALYRDGCKLSQPLNTKTTDEDDGVEDEDGIEAAKQEVAAEVAMVAGRVGNADTESAHRTVEQIVERPLRRRLPETHKSVTHKFNVAGHEGYLIAGLYDDATPGELFITMAKEGSTIGGLMDSLGIAISVALQYGVPMESLVNKFTHQRFEPAGMTHNAEIPFAKSLVDYIFRWLGIYFIPGFKEANTPRRGEQTPGTTDGTASNASLPVARPALTQTASRFGAGSEPLAFENDGEQAPDRSIVDTPRGSVDVEKLSSSRGGSPPATVPSHQAVDTASGALIAAMTNMQADAPACDVCGTITVRSGTCYKCLNCGNSMGCS